MIKRQWAAIGLLLPLLVSGCATVGSKRTGDAAAEAARLQELEAEIETRDKKIEELESEIVTLRSGPAAPVSGTIKTGVLRVPGVTVLELQAALKRAGVDPGPLDGKLGSKTKEAIKEFQRRKNLKADGVVGAKTWAQLQ